MMRNSDPPSPVRKSPSQSAQQEVLSGATIDQSVSYTIGALAEEFSITTRTIRFYEARGLLSPERVGQSRRYTRRDRARLSLILRGKNLGFSLEDIADYLAMYDADPAQMAQTQLLLGKVETAIADLQSKRGDLERALRDLHDIRAKCVEHLKTSNR